MIPNIYEKKIGINILIYASIISSFFLVLQFLFISLFNIYFSGQLTFLNYRTALNGNIRPFSFFNEPSSFGFYNAFGLASLLYSKNLFGKKKNIFLLIISLALVLSLSTTSFGLLIFIWLTYAIGRISSVKLNSLIVIITFIVILTFLGIELEIFNRIYNHSIEGLLTGELAVGLYRRIGNFSYAWSYHDTIINTLFGVGIVDLDYFLPAIARIYIYYGLIGYLLIIWFFSRIYYKSDRLGRILILIAIVGSFFGDTIFGIQMIFYIPLVISSYKTKNVNIQSKIHNLVIEKIA
jgi:hypothetical protein